MGRIAASNSTRLVPIFHSDREAGARLDSRNGQVGSLRTRSPLSVHSSLSISAARPGRMDPIRPSDSGPTVTRDNPGT